MFGARTVVIFTTLLLSVFAHQPPHRKSHSDEVSNWERFQALLDTVDEVALHNVLHAVYPKFKDGVFSKDRTAVEQVHSENPIMASKLVHIAKRQSNNGTVANTATSSSSSIASPSTPQQTSRSQSSASSASSVSSVISSQLSSQIFASTVPSPTTVLVAPIPPTSASAITTRSGAVVYSTTGGGVVTLTSSAVSVSFSPSTSTHLYYVTSNDGSVATSTSLIVVNAPVTETAVATGGSRTTSSAGLQNGANVAVTGGFTAAIISILGFLATFF